MNGWLEYCEDDWPYVVHNLSYLVFMLLPIRGLVNIINIIIVVVCTPCPKDLIYTCVIILIPIFPSPDTTLTHNLAYTYTNILLRINQNRNVTPCKVFTCEVNILMIWIHTHAFVSLSSCTIINQSCGFWLLWFCENNRVAWFCI